MSKCVICTFIKMVISGLWNNVCPSVNKKKKEEKANLGFYLAISGIFLVCFGIVMLIGFLVSLLPEIIAEWIALILAIAFLVTFLHGLITGLIGFTKRTIDCIKAYWRKAKEECA